MTEGEVEDTKQSLSVEDVLGRKTKVKAKARDISAKNAQVSATAYRKAKELVEQNLSEEQLNKLRLGKITIDKAYRQLKNQKKRQDLLSNGTISNIQFSHSIRLTGGDFIEVSKDIPDNSIGLVFTDPPYQRGWLPFYEPLGKIACRVLKEGGSLVMYVGHYALPEIFDYMKNSGLKYWWLNKIDHTGSGARMFSKRIIVTWKPLLWFVKGSEPKTFEFMKDSVESQPPDKTLHPWVQSTVEAEYMISYLTIQNDVVFDPLMGTGTTAIAAIRLKRRFVGIEKDAETLAIARSRISAMISGEELVSEDENTTVSDNLVGKITAIK